MLLNELNEVVELLLSAVAFALAFDVQIAFAFLCNLSRLTTTQKGARFVNLNDLKKRKQNSASGGPFLTIRVTSPIWPSRMGGNLRFGLLFRKGLRLDSENVVIRRNLARLEWVISSKPREFVKFREIQDGLLLGMVSKVSKSTRLRQAVEWFWIWSATT